MNFKEITRNIDHTKNILDIDALQCLKLFDLDVLDEGGNL